MPAEGPKSGGLRLAHHPRSKYRQTADIRPGNLVGLQGGGKTTLTPSATLNGPRCANIPANYRWQPTLSNEKNSMPSSRPCSIIISPYYYIPWRPSGWGLRVAQGPSLVGGCPPQDNRSSVVKQTNKQTNPVLSIGAVSISVSPVAP